MGFFPFAPAALSESQSPPWLPGDNGLLAADADPLLAASNTIMIAGTLYLMKLTARSAITVTNIWIEVQTGGLGASSGSFAGVYSSAGLLLTGSADIGGSLLAAADVELTLTTPQIVAGGSFVWVALLVNLATTQPILRGGAGASATAANINLNNTAWRFATNGTGLSALPGSITPASNAQGAGETIWVGVS